MPDPTQEDRSLAYIPAYIQHFDTLDLEELILFVNGMLRATKK